MKSITLLLSIGLTGMHVFSYANSPASPLNTHTGYVNLGPGCHVRGAMPFDGTMGGSYRAQSGENGGGFSIGKFPKKYGATELQVNMQCYNSADLHFPKGLNVRFDSTKKIWVKDFSERSYADDAESYKKLDKASRVYNIQAKNSNGYVYTEDDLIGEEWQRDRNMHFCLLRPPKALCGDAPVMRLNDPKSNVLPYVLQILRSIEFIDDAPPEQPSAVPDARVQEQ